MKIRAIFCVCAALLLVSGLLMTVSAGEEKKTAVEGAKQEDLAQAASSPNAEEMAVWAKYANPGEGHKLLEPMVGTFSAASRWWAAPGAPPMEATGTTINTWILDGRFVRQEYHSEVMGQPFEGLGFTGYDLYKKKYVGTWMDTMGTMIMMSMGDAAADGKSITMLGEVDDVIKGKTATIRAVTRVIDHDRHVFEIHSPDETGKEFKAMEITYTRK